ncbi:hypothetical protein THOM_2198 [Trachipleistophora hominis]|uniref:Uncharacterized protein n=1 Tax=Trachipleistophora hominis TaxID=72359 RepID=L7JTX1_TRAHO|nr:hypothetical protein THOM_2198 [Trachipleistophora hominis]
MRYKAIHEQTVVKVTVGLSAPGKLV